MRGIDKEAPFPTTVALLSASMTELLLFSSEHILETNFRDNASMNTDTRFQQGHALSALCLASTWRLEPRALYANTVYETVL